MDRTDPKVSVVTTATSMYFAPSDRSGTTEDTKELIHAMTLGKSSLIMTQYLSGWDSHLGLTTSQWHSFMSFSPLQSKAFVVRLPLLSGSPMSAIHLTKTQGCGWFRERNDRMARLLWTSYLSIRSCKAAICFPCMEK